MENKLIIYIETKTEKGYVLNESKKGELLLSPYSDDYDLRVCKFTHPTGMRDTINRYKRLYKNIITIRFEKYKGVPKEAEMPISYALSLFSKNL